MTRKIKIYTTAGMPGTIETNVSTLGELKPLLRQREINYDGMKMLVGETKNELSVDEALLPTEDFKLYLMPAKTKSGIDFEEVEENITNIYKIVENIEDKIDTIESTVDRVEDKLDKVLDLLKTPIGAQVVSGGTSSISAEDQREIDELRRLSAGGSNEWDD